jgi:hypothetical protein
VNQAAQDRVGTVGVVPPAAFERRRRLFAALERIFAVRFQPRTATELRGLAAVIAFGEEPELNDRLHSNGLPTFVAPASPPSLSAGRRRTVEFSRSSRLDERLRGRVLADSDRDVETPLEAEGFSALAHRDADLLWQTRDGPARFDRVACSVVDLAAGESLRDHLRSGNVFGLLPLFDFLRAVSGYRTWSRMPTRATFLIDDPNLHWRTYGYVRFQELAEAASAQGYHVTFATVPLDSWFAWPSVARLFRANDPRLSLAAHGVYHLHEELADPRELERAARALAGAAARLDRFERRFGVPVGRVMIPPHGWSRLAVHAALLATRFEALCEAPRWWWDWPDSDRSSAGIEVADVSPAGLPVMCRFPLAGGDVLDDALISAYLDQPIVWYGHHDDLADGYEGLAELAHWLRTVGPTEWLPLARMARTSARIAVEQAGTNIRVRIFSRVCELALPEGAERIVVEALGPLPAGNVILCGGREAAVAARGAGWVSEAVSVRALDSVEIVPGPPSVAPSLETVPAAPLKAVARRAGVEARDRLHPVVRRLHGEAVLSALETVHRNRRDRQQATRR